MTGYTILPEQDSVEFDWLLDRVRLLNPKRILELGTRLGGSLYDFFIATPNRELIVAVDTFPPRWDIRGFLESWGNVRTIQGNTQSDGTIGAVARLAPFDFLFIDADHDYPMVSEDYRVYKNFVRFGGLIGFHDICPNQEVSRLWNEIKSSGCDTEEIIVDQTRSWGGIGVIHVA